jgi:AAA domain
MQRQTLAASLVNAGRCQAPENLAGAEMTFSHKLPPDLEAIIADADSPKLAPGDNKRTNTTSDQTQSKPEPSAKTKPVKEWWRPKLINVKGLCDMRFDPLKYVVPGLIPEGVTLLASRPKLGKSWLLLQITTAVANGTVTLATGDDKPPVGDVLYLALEDNPRRLQRRLTKYFGGISDTWPERLVVATEWRRLDQGGLDGIREWCRSVPNPVLVAIDTLKKVRPPKRNGQSDYDADYEACEGLQKLAGEFGLSIIVAHHDRKMGADDVFDTVSGTLGLTGGVDAIALLKRNAGAVTLHIQGRDMEDEVEKIVRFDRETCRWAVVGEASEVQDSSERDRVLTALRAAPEGLSPSEIWAAARFPSRNATDKALSRLADEGVIERVRRGIYGIPRTGEKSAADRSDCQIGTKRPETSTVKGSDKQ